MDEDKKAKKIDRISKKIRKLDDICGSIYLQLILSKNLRYNELYRAVVNLNPKQVSGKPYISRPTFDEHLSHLSDLKLVIRKEIGKQNVLYSLNRDGLSIFRENSSDSKDIEEWIERINSMSKILDPFNAEEYYEKMTEKRIDEEIIKDFKEVFKTNLNELKAYVKYDSGLEENQSDAEFWSIFGNPLYRMLIKVIAENCRASPRYRDKFFEKVEVLLQSKESIDLGK